MARVTKDGVMCYAHPITVGQYERMGKKGLDAFKAASLSERAKKEGTRHFPDTDLGVCYTPTVRHIPRGFAVSVGPLYVDTDGRLDNMVDFTDNAGLRVSLHPIYRQDSKIVKTAQMQARTTRIFNGKGTEETTSIGKVVTVGGIKYLWLNEDECKNGTEKGMDLVSVELVARAVTSPCRLGPDYDYLQNTKFQQQCEAVALENCDEEELALLQEGLLSKEDNYENWASLEVKKERPNSAKEVYKQIESGKLTPEEGKQALMEILNEIESKGDAKDIQKFTQDLEAEHQAYLERHASMDAAMNTIDGLNFGGDKK